MKRMITFCMLACILLPAALSQVPQALKYKAIAKDEWGLPLPCKSISLRFSILLDDLNGEMVYQEVHYTKTTLFGLMDVNIGEGKTLYGYFDEIDWSAGSYYMKIELDPKGGNNFRLEGGDRLLSVPFALYAGNVSNKDDADADPTNELITNLYLSGTYLYILEGNQTTLVDLSGLRDGTEDADADPQNELQDLVLVGNILKITHNGEAAEIDLSRYLDDTKLTEAEVDAMVENNGYLKSELDADPANELQVLSMRNDTIFLSEGGWVKLPAPTSISGTYYYGDKDGDGFGDRYKVVWLPENVTVPAGFVLNPKDCNDNNSTINPDAAEIEGDGFDNDCDGEIDEIIILESDPVTDIDGNIYGTIIIGTQTWMRENLKTTKFNNGTAIPLITDNIAWSNLRTPGYCWYYDPYTPTLDTLYGALYNWYTVNTNYLCPTGWHVPSDDEWLYLTDQLGGMDIAGGKLKEVGTLHWLSPNTGATNETGFTALPGSYRFDLGQFGYIPGGDGYWWTSTEFFTGVLFRSMRYSQTNVVRASASNKNFGYSVRCVKD